MLESITIKKTATYDEAGIQITGLKKVNFIYGANGSEKTTITKIIHSPIDYSKLGCLLEWKNNIPINSLIYNRDFKEKNFGKGNIDGVFTLGQATKEDIESIAKMQSDLLLLKENGIKKKATLDKQIIARQDLEEEFKETVWTEIYKKHEIDLKEAFVGVMKKDSFRNKILGEFQTNKKELKAYTVLKESAQTVFGKMPTVMHPIPITNTLRIDELENENIWQKKIIGKIDIEIGKLIQKLNLSDWVNEGRNYLQENDTCPFCQKSTINDEFKKSLEDYFDETFTEETKKVKNFSDEYDRISLNLVHILQQTESKEKLNSDTKLDINLFSAYLKTLESQFASNREVLESKIKEPSRSVTLTSSGEQINNIQQLIIKANEEIDKHNHIVTNYSTERNSLIESIWKYLVEENRNKIDLFIGKLSNLQKGIGELEKQQSELREQYTELQKNIRTANKNVTSVQPSVDEINQTLKYYGFFNFEIVPSKSAKNQYQIHRLDGTVAESTLSEGEITFITFLYFLQLAKGSTSEDSISDERILVLDDPISSLDSSILFVVSSLLKEIIKSIKRNEGNIRQLILLTHNVYFHKEVSFVDGRTPINGDTHYWILRKNANVSTLQSYEMKNPIQNSYELLWQEIKNRDNNSGVTIQNTMRRIIENYFKILGKYADDDLIKKFTNHQEQEICRSLICWINDGSHGIPDDIYIEHQDATMDKYFEVFKDIFEKMGHQEHYTMMMKELKQV